MTIIAGCSWPLCLLPWSRCWCGYRLAGPAAGRLVVIVAAHVSRILLVRIVLVFMVPEGVAQMLRRLASSEV